MKNMKRIICVAFLIIVSLSLCSCDKLDELKEMRIPITENGIEYNGKIYKQLVAPTLYYDRVDKGLTISHNSKNLYILVEEDVPLLLIEKRGTHCTYDEELDIICSQGKFYCTDDNYQKYWNILVYGKLDHYRLNCVDFESGERIVRIMGGDFADIIDSAYDDEYHEVSIDKSERYDCIDLYKCDESGFLKSKTYITLYRDSKNDKYGVVSGSSSYYGSYTGNEFKGEQKEMIAEFFDEYYSEGRGYY